MTSSATHNDQIPTNQDALILFLTSLFYFHPGLATAVTAALTTAAGIQEYQRRRKPNP